MTRLHTSPEAQLLLETVCAPAPRLQNQLPAGGPGTLDWLSLAQLAEREKLLGVVWPALSMMQELIPAGVAANMRRQALVSEFRMAALERRLHDVLRVLGEHDVPVMLMKGAALAVAAYGSFASRPMGDLDLLVPEPRANDAWQAVRDAGWTPEVRGADDFYARHQHLCPLIAPGGGRVVVEIHRTLLHPDSPFRFPEHDVWDSAQSVNINGWPASVPAVEYQAVHLCIHFAWSHQMGSGLARTIRDLGVLAARMDWDHVSALARRAGATSCCYWTLRLASDLGGVPVPAGVLSELAPQSPGWMLPMLERVLAAQALDPLQDFPPSLRVGRLAWSLAIRPRASGFGAVRPWHAAMDFDRATHAAAPPPVQRRVLNQFARLPRWAHFLAVSAGLQRPSRRTGT